ncbi:MAG: hypothetical protein A3F67_08410 [Verrucomicrobia bacterium RIFCSPHIGHO2_12_FULL_41_10]|nr:MAG: hypothetical protein A3F67_08410 [Verrucomicrobia bacterium RIFCSPHIGHO2_12_FULL_41_10]HLB33760.1 hypothetical protein [Chthoniobacterales bacterium]
MKTLYLFIYKHSVNPLIECGSTNHQNSSNCDCSSEPLLSSSISYFLSPIAAAISPTSHLSPPTFIRSVGRIVTFILTLSLSASLSNRELFGQDHSDQQIELTTNCEQRPSNCNSSSEDLSCSMMMDLGGVEEGVSKMFSNLLRQGESTATAAERTGSREMGRIIENSRRETTVIANSTTRIADKGQGYEGLAIAQAAAHTADQAKEEIAIIIIAGGAVEIEGDLTTVVGSRMQTAQAASARANLLAAHAADAAQVVQAAPTNQGGDGKSEASFQSLTSTSTEEKEGNFLEIAVKKAAVWEARVNEALIIASAALEVVSDHHRTMIEYIKEYETAVEVKTAAAKEALDQRSAALKDRGPATVGVILGGAVSAVCMNPVPLVMGGVRLATAVQQGITTHREVKKTSIEVDDAMVYLNYANAKATLLTKTKAKAEALSAALIPIKQAAELSLLDAIDAAAVSDIDTAFKENKLTAVREEAAREVVVLKKAAAAELIEWALKNLDKKRIDRVNTAEELQAKEVDLVVAEQNYASAPFLKAEKEWDARDTAKKSVEAAKKAIQECDNAIVKAEEHLLHAQSIFDAVESRDTVVAQKERAFQELDIVREQAAIMNKELKSAEDAYPAIKQAYLEASLLYNRKKLAIKRAAKAKIKDLQVTAEEWKGKVTQAENAVETATKALDDIDNRVVEWDNLRSWSIAVMGEPMVKKLEEQLAKKQAETESIAMVDGVVSNVQALSSQDEIFNIPSTLRPVIDNQKQTAVAIAAKETFMDRIAAEDEYAAMVRARKEEKAQRRAKKISNVTIQNSPSVEESSEW